MIFILLPGKNFYPRFYEREFLGTKVFYGYNTFKIIDQDDAQLDASNNPFAMAVLSAKLALSRNLVNDQQLFDLAYDLAKRLLGKKMPKEKIRKVMNFCATTCVSKTPECLLNLNKR